MGFWDKVIEGDIGGAAKEGQKIIERKIQRGSGGAVDRRDVREGVDTAVETGKEFLDEFRYGQRLGGMTKEEATQLQNDLNAAGYNVGGADGVPGNRTKQGLRDFAEANGLKITEQDGEIYIPTDTLRALDTAAGRDVGEKGVEEQIRDAARDGLEAAEEGIDKARKAIGGWLKDVGGAMQGQESCGPEGAQCTPGEGNAQERQR